MSTPLDTTLHRSATAVHYPKPTRVKNKTAAPVQARARAFACATAACQLRCTL